MLSTMTQLAVDNVTKEYPTRDRPLSVLRGCSLALAAGHVIADLIAGREPAVPLDGFRLGD